jgi:hypothetical protein
MLINDEPKDYLDTPPLLPPTLSIVEDIGPG